MTKTSKGRKARQSLESKDAELSRGGAYQRFMAMTPAQRDAEVAKYDLEDLTPGKPLTAADKALHRRAAARGARTARAKLGRPTIGAGAKIVPVTIERGLLKKADAFAKRHQLKRSQMVAQGLRLVMEQGKAG
ncbi:MAG TPA: hypothetical protein VGR35_19175 [Tepidisphaeraceae bacterium]|nr:hypothetical protein [Tepidisphaeraceae bacterium]